MKAPKITVATTKKNAAEPEHRIAFVTTDLLGIGFRKAAGDCIGISPSMPGFHVHRRTWHGKYLSVPRDSLEGSDAVIPKGGSIARQVGVIQFHWSVGPFHS